jgi:hypothetical protein
VSTCLIRSANDLTGAVEHQPAHALAHGTVYLPRFDSSRRRSTVSVDVTGKTASNRFQNSFAGATPKCRVTTSFMRGAARRSVLSGASHMQMMALDP